MKQTFKPIKYLTETELEDLDYFMLKITPEKSGLENNIFIMNKPYFNKNTPHLFISDDLYGRSENYTVVKISANPYVVYEYITKESRNINMDQVSQFIKLNKRLLEKYWNWKTSTKELNKNIRKING